MGNRWLSVERALSPSRLWHRLVSSGSEFGCVRNSILEEVQACEDVMNINRIAIVVGALLLLHNISHACPSCFGDASSSEVQGMKWAITALLAVTGTVLLGMSSLFLYLRKRANEINERFINRLN